MSLVPLQLGAVALPLKLRDARKELLLPVMLDASAWLRTARGRLDESVLAWSLKLAAIGVPEIPAGSR